MSRELKKIAYSIKRQRRWQLVRYWQLYVLILPALIYIIIFNYVPIYGVQIAFRDFRSGLGIWNSPFAGLKHFIRFFDYPYFGRIVWNTLSINLYALVIGFPTPILLALLINEIRNRSFKRSVQMVTYAPHFISTVVLCGMILLFTNERSGFINHFIEWLGFSRIDFMIQPQLFKSIYVLTDVWQHAGWGTIIYMAALSGISIELVEAARIDGANRIQIIRHINIPSIAPTIIILLILRCGQLLSLGFEKVWLLQNPLNISSSEIISTYVYKMGIQGAQFSYSAAIGLFNNVINFILLVMVNALSRRMSETSLW